MLRDLAESLSRYLLQEFPDTHGYAAVEFSRGPMPPLVAAFLSQMLQARVDLEAARLNDLHSEWFNFSHPDVQAAQGTLMDVLGRHARIPREEWPRLLKEAVSLVLLYLVRPVPTLINFVYDENDGPVSTAEIFQGFSFFGAYPYLREIAGAYFKQKNVREIDRDRLEAVLSHSDRQLTHDYEALDWLRLTAPLFNLLNADPGNLDRTVPIEVLEMFFDEKDAGHIQVRLREAAEGHEHGRITEQEFRRLLETPAEVPHAVSEEPPPVQPPPPVRAAPPTAPPTHRPVMPPPQAAAPPAPRPISPAPPAEAPKNVPLWQQFQQQPAASASRPEEKTAPPRQPVRPAPPPQQKPAPPQPPPTSQPKAGPGDREAPLWMQFRKPGPPAPDAPARSAPGLAELERQILGESGAKNRDVFVAQLFGGSRPAYEHTLSQLQSAHSWNEASRIIAAEVFKKHRVNIYSDPAVLFTNAVEEQFR